MIREFNSNKNRNLPFEHRFWEKVDIRGKDECWEWQAGLDTKGYGIFLFRGHTTHTHRISWILKNGEISSSKILVCHSCDNRRCVNPEHLFLGSTKDNADDMVNKGRNKFPIMYGLSNPNGKLSDEQVKEIRSLYSSGHYTYKSLAKKFGIAFQTVGNIVSGKRHTNV